MTKRVLALDPKTYRRHAMHGPDRIWAETNCYTDLWIELLHALGHEPAAALPFTLTIDFEGDQWTFFKFPLADLFELYGMEVQELALWRPLTAHLEEQLGRGRPVLVEVDSYYLPDTAGTAYRTAHVKTTIGVVEIDPVERRLGYFHNQGYFQVGGDDFTEVLRTPGLPPYAELVKIRETPRIELREASLRLLRKHLALLPAHNPLIAFKERLGQDLSALQAESLEMFHLYSFATLRQFGACYELSGTYLQWLGDDELAQPFLQLSEGAKAFQFQLARSMSRKKPLDLAPLDAMAERWERGTAAVRARHA